MAGKDLHVDMEQERNFSISSHLITWKFTFITNPILKLIEARRETICTWLGKTQRNVKSNI